MANIMLRPSYWASVSGGKDSLYMLKVILENPEEYPLDGVVHFELEIDYPFIKDVIAYMRSECERFGIPFHSIKPRRTWRELYDKWGFPSRQRRWCNDSYKLDAERQLREFLKGRGERPVQYIGFCVDEEKRFKEQLGDRDNVKQIYPLAEKGIFEVEILEWAKTVPLFNGFYKHLRRCGCMFCPMMTIKEMAYLFYYYPDHYREMLELAQKTEAELTERFGKPYSCWNGNPRYNTAYRDRMAREVYLPQLLKEINGEDEQLEFVIEART